MKKITPFLFMLLFSVGAKGSNTVPGNDCYEPGSVHEEARPDRVGSCESEAEMLGILTYCTRCKGVGVPKQLTVYWNSGSPEAVGVQWFYRFSAGGPLVADGTPFFIGLGNPSASYNGNQQAYEWCVEVNSSSTSYYSINRGHCP